MTPSFHPYVNKVLRKQRETSPACLDEQFFPAALRALERFPPNDLLEISTELLAVRERMAAEGETKAAAQLLALAFQAVCKKVSDEDQRSAQIRKKAQHLQRRLGQMKTLQAGLVGASSSGVNASRGRAGT